MKRTVSTLILLFILSCKKSDYKNIDFGSFELTVPQNWEEYEVKGTDSYVGGLVTNEQDTLIFDLGWYSGDLTNNIEILVFSETEYSEFSKKQRNRLEKVKYLVVDDKFTAEYDAKEYLKYKFTKGTIACFSAKFIEPTNKGFGASGIYIDSLKGSRKTYDKTSMSFYGNDLSESTQVEFFQALKTMEFKDYCK
ncbi:hypothetical protein [Flavobacterium tegetincola]|uniref:hypothetical protein n=1 Tax=Flavobacterium tegetincola TaxID=150172 RepID=UPI0004179584|nr:hypothetical protein [Flavobacterium tegetincola]